MLRMRFDYTIFSKIISKILLVIFKMIVTNVIANIGLLTCLWNLAVINSVFDFVGQAK